jgi:hypothetical protein
MSTPMKKIFAMIGVIVGSGLGTTILSLITQHAMAIDFSRLEYVNKE